MTEGYTPLGQGQGREGFAGLDRTEIDRMLSELYGGGGASLTQAEADALYKAIGYVPAWAEITGKPATFPPSLHKASHASGGGDAIAPGDIGAAASGHTHPRPRNYQALLETNLDLLMRGTLYTRASPFSQSFAFSGDGTRVAYKIPRGSVEQQGWVRGGVSATVGGAAASGTYNVHTQTFTFDAAPASGTDNVVVSSTDVVPYQGMMSAAANVEVLRMHPTLVVTTSGTGASTNDTQVFLPLSPKLPSANIADDDAHLNDTPNAGTFIAGTRVTLLPPSKYASGSNLPHFVSGETRQAGAKTASATLRGRGDFGAAWFEGPGLNAAMPHTTALAFLGRVPSASGSLAAGELVVGVLARYTAGSGTVVGGSGGASYSFDLFRLSGGPVVEA